MKYKFYYVRAIKSRSNSNKYRPIISISGDWLHDIGFTIDSLITIEYKENMLELLAHPKGMDTYTNIYKDVFENKKRLIQVGTDRRALHGLGKQAIRPTFDLSGRWLESFGFVIDSIVILRYQMGLIHLKVLDTANIF